MAVKFKWKFKDGHKKKKAYIYWKATWDGKYKNDPLFSKKYGTKLHPFCRTIDYEQAEQMHKYYSNMTDEELAEDWLIDVIQDDGSIKTESMGSRGLSRKKVKAMKAENIRSCGDAVANNKVTRALCKLLSDDEEIARVCGNVDPYWYRTKLLRALSSLWD